MESFYKLVGPLVTFSGKKYDSPQQVLHIFAHPCTSSSLVMQLVDEFFEAMDTNGDNKISIAEYKEGALKNPDIIQGLKLFS
jgi:hypothetical protein